MPEIRIFLPEFQSLGKTDHIPLIDRYMVTDLYASRTERYRIYSKPGDRMRLNRIMCEPGSVEKETVEIQTLPAMTPQLIVQKEGLATGVICLPTFYKAPPADHLATPLLGQTYVVEKLVFLDKTVYSIEMEMAPELLAAPATRVARLLDWYGISYYLVTDQGLYDVLLSTQPQTWVPPKKAMESTHPPRDALGSVIR